MNLKPSFLILFVAITCFVEAQVTPQQKQLAEAISFTAGGTFGKSKIPKKTTRLAIPEININFMQVMTKSVTVREKKRSLFGKTAGKAATGFVTTYLETTDGELEQADYQEVVNHFYYYLQSTLKKNNIDTVAWDAITATEYYKDGSPAKQEDDEDEKKKGNVWTSAMAFNGNTMYGGKAGKMTAFNKHRRVSRMAGDLQSDVLFLRLNVDFADIDVDVNVKTSGYISTWTPTTSSQTLTRSSNTSVAAVMKISASNSQPTSINDGIIFNDNEKYEGVYVASELPAEMDYATSLEEDETKASKKKNKWFSVSLSKKLESTPVVINTTKNQYKAAAKKALEKYADALVAKFVVMKND